MINNNKILTVSYGTFSCTLEGFDDSFGTMKAIAEYFRDLSADDRYFGAEPVQPDAQMLARIAEREISRHVEAREDKGRIVLSAQSAPQQAAALVASDAVEDVAEAIAGATVEKATKEQAASEAAAAKQEEAAAAKVQAKAPETETPTVKVSLTAPKPRIVTKTKTFAVDHDIKEAVVPEEAPKAEVKAEPEAAPVKSAEAERVIVPSLPDEDVEAFFAEGSSADPSTKTALDDFEDDATPAQDRAKADSIADKLKRIRAVVSQQGEAVAAPDYSEDQHADATVAPAAKIIDEIADIEDEEETSTDVLADTLRDLEDALEADDEFETADDDTYDKEHADTDGESDDDDIAAILSRLEGETDTSALPANYGDEENYDDDEDYFDDEDEDDTTTGNILATMDSVEAGADDVSLTDENLFEEDETGEDDTDEVEPEAPAPVAPKPAPRTRVLKVKRATLEAAIQSGQLEEYDDDEEEEDEAPANHLRKAPLASRSTLSDEEEEALARELAELEADMASADEFEDDEDDFAVQAAVAPRARIRAPADEDFSRLMEESEQQMEEPEAATRRDAFAHLRAAVAAKKADEAVVGTDDNEEADEAYRDDLASVVRPRRPVSGERTRTERPAEPRPAPLKLVAEQRIDTGEIKRVAPVRPRRVAAAPTPAPHAAQQSEDFADFADQMGATKLPDLLEAAAAYLSFVEGHEQFSRPQLMTKVRQVEKENFTREDSLRSFGKLLREGKIEKMKGGRFQASDQIGFKPAKRAAG
ncbi:hypothetical protein [uncultured Sulfitobacter sp.]|uniref:hypothetical protein n=1 Tax=uncultured Sulfitobacter sp. TaxID=191468 RepID=UPI00260E66D0|nr:hypothetical protein [uncultured Sulfitobacter sp.]